MQVPIDSIILEHRVRQELGDLSALMASLQKYGQLNPIIMTRDSKLIAGHRRLESARRLGWTAVEAVAVDRNAEVDRLEIELQENVHRKDLSPAELVDGYTRLEKLKRPSAWRRLGRFFKRLFDKLCFWRRKKELPAADLSHGRPDSSPAGTEAPAVAERTDDEYKAGDYVV